MTKRSDLGELFATINKLRNDLSMFIPQEIVEQIIMLEDKFFDERPSAQREIEKIIDGYLTSTEVDKCSN